MARLGGRLGRGGITATVAACAVWVEVAALALGLARRHPPRAPAPPGQAAASRSETQLVADFITGSGIRSRRSCSARKAWLKFPPLPAHPASWLRARASFLSAFIPASLTSPTAADRFNHAPGRRVLHQQNSAVKTTLRRCPIVRQHLPNRNNTPHNSTLLRAPVRRRVHSGAVAAVSTGRPRSHREQSSPPSSSPASPPVARPRTKVASACPQPLSLAIKP